MGLTWKQLLPVVFATWTTAERDAVTDPPAYLVIYNTTLQRLEIFDNIDWQDFLTYYGTATSEEIPVWNSTEGYWEPKDPAEYLAMLSGEAAAAFGMNSQKITGLAEGSETGDAIEYDQLQTELWAGIDDGNLVRIDHEEGAEEQDYLRCTEDGVEPRSPAEVLEDLSGIADDPFDWNDQEVRNIRKLFIGGDRVEARWGHAITVEDPAADDVIPILPFYEGRVTITNIKDAVIGDSTTATYNIEWRPTLNGTGTDLFVADVVATTTDADRKTEDFQSPQSSPAGGWLVCAISAVSGTAPDFLAIGLRGAYAP